VAHKKNLDDYFKCMQHTGQRPLTHHTTLPIGYTYPINLCGQEVISTNWPHTGTKYQSTGWESNPWHETHNLRPRPFGQWEIQAITLFIHF